MECSMASKRTLSLDWEPVDPEAIRVYDLPGQCHPTISMVVREVQTLAPFESQRHRRDYEVEIEFNPDSLALDETSFAIDYLASYRDAKVIQESMTRKIRSDLCRSLGIEDVFVEVRRESKDVKRTRIGKP